MSLFLIAPQDQIEEYKNNVKIDVVSEGRVIETLKTTFISPPAQGQAWGN